MRKVLKWVGVILGGLVILLVVFVGVLYGITASRLNKVYRIQPAAVTIPTDAVSLERGRHLAEAVTGCQGCHGDNLAGKIFIDDPQIGRVYATNLTAGKGSAGETYTDADWVRALRHGVGPDGKLLLIMPSDNYNVLSDEDLGAVIAYVKSLQPVNNVTPAPRLTFFARLLFALGAFGKMPAEEIDHAAVRRPAPPVGITVDYGRYLATAAGCQDCHGRTYGGGRAGPGAPLSPNITPGGHVKEWTEADFITALRTGVTPENEKLDPKDMPWPEYARMADAELKAMWLYLRFVPAVPATER